MTSYPTPAFTRPALAPGIIAAIVLVAGAALVGTDGFTWIRYVTSILALIVAVFAWQATHWWWLIGLVPIAVLWNPVFVIPLEGVGWQSAQFLAAILFTVAGVMIKVRNADDRNRRS